MKKLVLATITASTAAAFLFSPNLFISSADAASFNCRYAKLAAEVAICQDSRLSRLDERMASKYFRLKNRLPRHIWRQVRDGQKRWLRSRNRCGYNFNCIDNSYRNRIYHLNSWLNNY